MEQEKTLHTLDFIDKKTVFRKKEWEKSWPPVNTLQFQLIFIQMLTPINRWHNVPLHFLFCIAFFKNADTLEYESPEKTSAFALLKNRHIVLCWSSQPLDFDFAYTVCIVLFKLSFSELNTRAPPSTLDDLSWWVHWQAGLNEEICIWRTWCFWNTFSSFEISGNRGRTRQIESSWKNTFFPPRVLHPPLRVTELRNVDFAIHATLLSNKGWSRCQVHVLAVEIKQ